MKTLKKLFKYLMLIIAVFSLTNCGSKSKTKTSIVFGSFFDTNLTSINFAELEAKINDNESFLICSYADVNCVCWNVFEKNVLEIFIARHNARIFTINVNQLTDENFGIKVLKDRPTFAIFNNGEVFEQITYSEKDEKFKDIDQFERWIEDYITYPEVFEINKNQLDQMYLSDIPFTVMIGRKSCLDCKYICNNELKFYFESNNKNSNLFIYYADEIYSNSNDWQTFKDEYGLSEKYNHEFGYSTGFVPTFIYIQPNGTGEKISTIKSMCVVFNDFVSLIDDKFIISNSFYSKERCSKLDYLSSKNSNSLIGMELDQKAVLKIQDQYILPNDISRIYHDSRVYSFLDKYL